MKKRCRVELVGAPASAEQHLNDRTVDRAVGRLPVNELLLSSSRLWAATGQTKNEGKGNHLLASTVKGCKGSRWTTKMVQRVALRVALAMALAMALGCQWPTMNVLELGQGVQRRGKGAIQTVVAQHHRPASASTVRAKHAIMGRGDWIGNTCGSVLTPTTTECR